jgi:flagellar biosynthesis/type III secretory pathway M-ring protein FliF/YscJ
LQDFFKTFFAQIQDFFGGLTPVKRMSLMASVGVGLAAFATIIMMTTGSDYAILLPNVPDDQVPNGFIDSSSKKCPFQN